MNKYLQEIIDTIENVDMRAFAEELVKTIPEYWYSVPASSTLKYHPSYACVHAGLARHTVAVVRFLNHTFNIECMNTWTSRERDILRIAAMMHDSRKSGSQEEFETNKYTKFNHPLLAAAVVRGFSGRYLSEDEIECIATTIESHMGAWNKDKNSDLTLPLPKDRFQKMLHWADYLASRKDIEMVFDSEEEPEEDPTMDTYKITFGKFKGKTLTEIMKIEPDYLAWCKKNLDLREPLKTLLTDI